MGTSLLILVVIAVFSLVAVRMGALALMKTGLSSDSASFQSYSAFFGVGFTTKEAELVVNHPVRRRIIRDLILVGNLGLMSGAATVVSTLVLSDGETKALIVIAAVILIPVVYKLLSKVAFLQRLLDSLLRFTLRRVGMVKAYDYELLLRTKDGYCVSEIEMLEENSFVGKTLAETRPADHGLIFLGVEKEGGEYIGAPGPDCLIEKGDVVMVYGTESAVHKAASDQVEESGFSD